ncbi:hypothetical protein PAPHI01_0804 [Pancytospora philotis]|nr:hypothetical protein PAPHI01_0804 [Pancytospora philotis]
MLHLMLGILILVRSASFSMDPEDDAFAACYGPRASCAEPSPQTRPYDPVISAANSSILMAEEKSSRTGWNHGFLKCLFCKHQAVVYEIDRIQKSLGTKVYTPVVKYFEVAAGVREPRPGCTSASPEQLLHDLRSVETYDTRIFREQYPLNTNELVCEFMRFCSEYPFLRCWYDTDIASLYEQMNAVVPGSSSPVCSFTYSVDALSTPKPMRVRSLVVTLRKCYEQCEKFCKEANDMSQAYKKACEEAMTEGVLLAPGQYKELCQKIHKRLEVIRMKFFHAGRTLLHVATYEMKIILGLNRMLNKHAPHVPLQDACVLP